MSTTTTTTTTTTTYQLSLQFDEFWDTVIDSWIWTDIYISGGATLRELDGVLEMTGVSESAYISQLAVTSIVDAYWKTTLPATPSLDANNSFWINDIGWTMYGQLVLIYGDYGEGTDFYIGGYWAIDDPYEEHQEYIKISQREVWFRCFYDPASGNTFRLYYTLTDPSPVHHTNWIEIGPSTVASVPGMLYEMSLQFGTGSADWANYEYFRGMPVAFDPDEFNVGPLGDLEHWGYVAWRLLNAAPWTVSVVDRNEFNYIQDGKVFHYWKSEPGPVDGGYYHTSEIDQGRIYDATVNLPYGNWLFYGLKASLDIYTKVSLPSTSTMTEVPPGGGNFQFILEDLENLYGPGIWMYHWNTHGPWQWEISSWMSGYDDGYEESAYIGLGADALDVWVRMTWPLDGSPSKIYYALEEPIIDSDWIDLTPLPDTYPFFPNGVDLPFMQMFSQGNSFNLSEDLLVSYEYFRRWPFMEVLPNWSQAANPRGTINEGFGGFGFGWS